MTNIQEQIKYPIDKSDSEILVNTPFETSDCIDEKEFIEKIFTETGYTLRDAKNTSNALKKIAGDLYTETERFIFELLQNADDIPNDKKEVNVKFMLLSENLLFLHNGRPFNKEDVNSIASIGDSTKQKDSEKTGYKGIGFKSVFTDAETVLINSGNFSFSFDKLSPLYKNKNIDEIPWEIKPIWTEQNSYPKEVKECSDFFTSPVAIDLKVGETKIQNYRSQIEQLFSEPRFILFLRHIKTIEVSGLTKNVKIQKIQRSDRFTLLNNDVSINEWLIDNFEFKVTAEIREGMENDKIVPEKLKEIQKSKLSFACQINNNKIESINPIDSFLFTYLPTNVNDYKFPFLVNADFLTTANRQSIHVKNIWNLYLFEQIGFLCFEWISKITQNEDLRFTITNLIPLRFDNSIEPIHKYFNTGFDKGIEEIAFLPTINNGLCKVSDALVDFTGLSQIIGEELFVEIINPTKTLIDYRLENKSKLAGLQGISFFREDELQKIFTNPLFIQHLNPQFLLEILIFLYKIEYNSPNINLLLSENNDKTLFIPCSLYFQTDETDKSLLTFSYIYFLHQTINNYAENNHEFKNWLLSLGVQNFDGRDFITKHILNSPNSINPQIIDKTNNLNFWRFIFKYELLDSEIKILASFYIFNTNNVITYNLSCCYLSDYYKNSGDPSVEEIAVDLGLSGFNFISPDYCINTSDKVKWRKLFQKAGLKRSQNIRIYRESIIPFIQSGGMNINNYMKITKFVFEVFKDAQDRSSFDSVLSNFLVFTTSGILCPISQCILSDDYTQDSRLASILPEQILHYQIDSIYLQQISPNQKNWKEFFCKLNPCVEINYVEIVKRKIVILASCPNLVTVENVHQIWKTILDYKDDLLKTHKEILKRIPLLLKSNILTIPIICYFPKEYNPTTEIEELLTGYYDYFISPSFISNSGYTNTDLKLFFKEIGVDEEIKRSNIGNYNFDIHHKEHFFKFDFIKKFWSYFQKYQGLFQTNMESFFKNYVLNYASIPCLDNTVQPARMVHSYKLKDLVNDNSVTCCIEFSPELEIFLGLQQHLTISKCFKALNDIADLNDTNAKKIKSIYDHLFYRFSDENIILSGTDIANFKQGGKLLSNKGNFQNVTNLFYQDITANYLPLDESDNIIKRFGDKNYWKKFETVLTQLGIQIITASDFCLDKSSSKQEAIELKKTLSNSIGDFAEKIDSTNSTTIENQLRYNLSILRIYYSPNFKMACSKLNYSPTVPNYYDNSQKTIFYSGNWNSISNTKLIEYLFFAFDISENQISKDEFVSILLRNIPKKHEMPSAPPESISPDWHTGRFGEELVYQELVAKFGESRVNWMNKGGESYREYDFEIYNNNQILYYIDAKSTTTGEILGNSVPFYIQQSEWIFMQKCKDNYLIARVYNAKSSNAYSKYLKMGLQNLHEIDI